MTYEQFLSILMNYKKYNETLSDAYDVGLDLLEGKFSTSTIVDQIVQTTFTSYYGEEGWDWVGWFIWENEFGQRGLEAYDEDGTIICQSYLDLYNYLEINHKSNQQNTNDNS